MEGVRGTAAVLTALLVAGCGQIGPGSTGYDLYTHCGIDWTRINGTWWKAETPRSDEDGNPPPGWDNPVQRGMLTFRDRSTAVFTSPAGSVVFHRTGRTRPPYICS